LRSRTGARMTYDFIVIGAGHNGLACAAYLAKAGAKVLVVERAARVGGACHTEETTLPGFKHNLCSVVHTHIPLSPVYRDLELERHGVRYVYPDYLRGTIFPDHRSIVMYRETERMAAELGRYSARDANTFRQLVADYGEFIDSTYLPLMYSPPLPPSLQTAELEKSEEGRALMQWQASTPVQLLNELFESEEVKVHFLSRMTVLGFAPDQFGQGWICLFRILKAEAPICVGGSQQLAHGLRSVFEKHGGVVRTDIEVKRIFVRGNRAGGVELADGTQVQAAKAVVTNVEPQKSFLRMVGEEHLPAFFVTRVKNYHSRGRSLFVLHLALSEPPRYRAAAQNGPVNFAFSQEMFGGSVQDQVRAYQEIAMGRAPRNEMLQITLPTLFDPSQAPAGKHTAVVWQYAPYALQGGWGSIREEYAEHLLALWRSYAPNMTRDKVLAMKIQDPTDTERLNDNLVNGVDVVGDMTPDQMGYFRPFAGWSSYRTPVEGLYMCGGYCHPGGGVHAGAGHNAATVIAEDFKLKRWWD
ncbi:MAG TPA: NAD(P)/FAD-dependent oxidoreductase, partial [Burkholderiales bacterium]|nr:NAD(P)/FAD-dependent oxidoreductase [Burkholderiales bacterium]